MTERPTDEQIAEWRQLAGPDDYGHLPLPECGEDCDGCVSDSRVAVAMNAMLDALEAERQRADAEERQKLRLLVKLSEYVERNVAWSVVQRLWVSRRAYQARLIEEEAAVIERDIIQTRIALTAIKARDAAELRADELALQLHDALSLIRAQNVGPHRATPRPEGPNSQ